MNQQFQPPPGYPQLQPPPGQYQQPQPQYAAPFPGAPVPAPAAPAYGAPQPAYGAPQPQYGAPQPGYGPPAGAPGYGPPAGYGAPPPQGYTPPGYAPNPPRAAAGGDNLAGWESADPTGSRLPHFNADRRYIVKLLKLEFFQARSDNFMTSEWEIIESDDPMLAAGRSAKYMIKWDQDMSMPNYKALLGALLGLQNQDDIKAISKQTALEGFGPTQPHKDKVLELRTVGTTTKGKNQPFTIHNWYPYGAAPALGAPAPAPQAAPQQGYGAPPAQYGAPPSYVAPQAAPQQGYGAPPAQYGAPAQTAPGFAPMPSQMAPPPAQFPPNGWYPHQQPGIFHNGKEAIPEAELRQRMAIGRA